MDLIIHVNGMPIPLTRPFIKYLIAMKLFLLILSLNAVASVHSQQITLTAKNEPLRDVLQSVRKQSGYYFMFSSDLLALAKPVTVVLKQASIEETLQKIFADQPFVYTIDEKLILVQAKEKQLDIIQQQRKELNGIVQDQDGRPLEGATVILKEQNNKVAITDDQGRFHFDNAPDNGKLLIRMIGRETKEVVYKNGKVSAIMLNEISTDIREIQIIAYGEVEKKYSTSNINGIKAEQIATQPVNNPLLALSGRIPGLFVQQNGATPGGAVNIIIQGKNSFQQGNTPFYVVDGVPYPLQTFDNINSQVQPGGPPSPLSYLSPSDIESIQVLKDADATAIYGSRAANGAILIFTKKGKSGKTKVELNSQSGWGKITRKVNVLNTPQYLELRKEAMKNGNTTPDATDYDVNGVWDQSRNTDWQDVLVGGTSKFTNIQASVSGGNANTQFIAGTGYMRETTVYPGDLADKKVNVHFNINHTSASNKFKFSLTGNYLQDDNTLAGSSLMYTALTLAPNAPPLYNADGTINWAPHPDDPTVYTFDNPLQYLFQSYNAKTYNLISNSVIGYEIIPGLEIKSSFGYNRITTDEINIIPQTSIRPDYASYGYSRESSFGNKYLSSYIIEPQLTFKRTLLGGNFDALLGGTIQGNNNYFNSISATGFTTDAQLRNPSSASQLFPLISNQYAYRYSALFGRLNYRYNNKYILNLAVRRDGSSRFGSENKLHNFYSVGGAWLFGDERFLKEMFSGLSFGKMRISYGTTGNDQIGDYGYLNLYNSTSSALNPYQGVVGLTPAGHSNPYLQWEETRKLNIGLDLGFIDDRITFTTNYFRNRSSNQLIPEPVPIFTGFSIFKRNLSATVQNTGWEFQLNGALFTGNNFRWESSVNLTIPKNKLVTYPNLEKSSSANNLIIDQPFNIKKVYHYLGINTQTGLYEFESTDPSIEKTSNPKNLTDRTQLVDLNPKFYGGFYNSVSYRGFSLDFLFQFVKQKGADNFFGNLPGSFNNNNQPLSTISRWTAPGDLDKVQKVSTNFGEIAPSMSAIAQSDAGYTDASYIRLKNAAVSYTLPNAITNRVNISQVRFFLQGQNLLLLTKYKGDPEIQGIGSLPPLKLYTVGLQLTF
jgi:TonB-linked SusC/RagA family outer membrane protein